MKPTRPTAPHLLREYRLWVYLETQSQPWHATLEKTDLSERLEFDSPLELARHLASLTNPVPRGRLR
ncbi:hypothetical protein [Meiothermus sp. CFH 77666]|uniref:hypothetical protein n=1 Tax=Meiothermus sp. CFH 77666 TaxID=2817942 RepID=UPI001AA01A86|nr:hypothetical protein [Meiothermus sp. CFH 77666]MBO1437548.1 hypothetical protein [Meiothermus sp. CFH 77666]